MILDQNLISSKDLTTIGLAIMPPPNFTPSSHIYVRIFAFILPILELSPIVEHTKKERFPVKILL